MRDSIFTKTRNAGTESEDLAAYCNNMAPITCRVGTQIFVVGLVTLMVAIGIININECNVNHLIPIYLIASGGLYIGWLIIEVGCDQCEYPNIKIWLRIIMSVAGTGLFIAGSVWVYGAWEEVEWKDSHREEDEYCSPWVYWVAFCDITIITALLLIGLFSGLVWGLLACCVKLCCKGSVDETTPLTAKSDSVSDSPA